MVAHHFSRTFLCLSVLPCETDPGTVQGRNVTLGELLSYLKVTTKFSEGTKPTWTRGMGKEGKRTSSVSPGSQEGKETAQTREHWNGPPGPVRDLATPIFASSHSTMPVAMKQHSGSPFSLSIPSLPLFPTCTTLETQETYQWSKRARRWTSG